VSVENIDDVFEKLEPLGFVFDEASLKLRSDQREKYDRLQEIKDNPVLYTGDLPLFDFQKKGFSFLKECDVALLGDTMGLGKTIQTIAAVEDDKSVLIIAPKSLLYNWADELHKWSRNAKVYVVDGNKEKRFKIYEEAKQYKEKFYLIIGYETTRIDFEELQKF
jgi:SNF2 family DNA or RNA helicase